jgi:hypothetical protein
VGLSLLLIGALGYWLLSVLNNVFSFAGRWEGKVLSASPSPDGRYVAEVSQWNGGATTGFETRVGLRRRSDRDTVSGGPQKEATVARLFSSPPVKLRWDTPQQLTVESPGGQWMEHRETWGDVRIAFKGLK